MGRFLQLNAKVLAYWVFVSAAAVAYAGVDEPDGRCLIREDRVWEYFLYDVSYSHFHDRYLFYMKFDGEEMRDGVVYHKFVFTGDESHWTVGNFDKYNGDLTTRPNEKKEYFLMREEGKRVYLYLDEQFSDVKERMLYYWNQVEDEILIYDFNLNADDSMDLYTLIYNYEMSYVIGEFYKTSYDVESTETVDVDGVDCTRLAFRNTIHGFSVLEGVGCEIDGILPMYNLDFYESGSGEKFCDLNRVYNSDGEIIYRGRRGEVDITTLGVASVSDATFEIRRDEIFASGHGGEVKVTVTDISGVEVISGKGRDEVTIPISSLAPGVYVAQCESGRELRQEKFVK